MVTLNNVTLKNMERNKLELSCIYPENGEKLSSSDKFDMKFYDVAKDGYSVVPKLIIHLYKHIRPDHIKILSTPIHIGKYIIHI